MAFADLLKVEAQLQVAETASAAAACQQREPRCSETGLQSAQSSANGSEVVQSGSKTGTWKKFKKLVHQKKPSGEVGTHVPV